MHLRTIMQIVTIMHFSTVMRCMIVAACMIAGGRVNGLDGARRLSARGARVYS
jgi:hypothetical protein